MRKLFVLFLLLLSGIMGYASDTFRNPVIYADVPDMSVIRVGDDFYMISTTMHLMPGAPVMKSKDLVNWEIVGYVFDKLTDTPNYDLKDGTVYGRGQWASSIRYHNGKFYVFFSLMTSRTKDIFIRQLTRAVSGSWYLVHRIFMMHLFSSMMMVKCIFLRDRLSC